MPVVDMPLHELENYKGVSPRPADFDAYWERAIKEMEALGTDCTLTPAKYHFPGVEIFDLTFTGVGGATVLGALIGFIFKKISCFSLLYFNGYCFN